MDDMRIDNGDEWERASDIDAYLEPEEEEVDTKKKSKEETDERKYRLAWESSRKFHENPENMKLFRDIVKLNKKIKIDQEELKQKREQLKQSMSKVTDKVYDVETGMMASISSKGRHSSNKFNEDAFKRDHPELYKKYLISSSSYSAGGTLTIREITRVMYNWMNKFAQEDKKRRIPPLHEMEEKFKIGKVMPILEYIDDVKHGCLISYDGWGEYIDLNGNNTEKTSSFNVKELEKVKHLYPYVLWYNR